VVGYIYTLAWGVSFLGQIGLNYKLKSAVGCNLDFVVYNITGFSFYAIYSTLGRWDDSVVFDVNVQDITFAYWAWCMTIITGV